MRWSRLALTACLSATLPICPRPVFTHGGQGERPPQHASHSPVTSEERALRELLARYRRGDVAGAIEELHAQPRDWSRRAMAACQVRVEDHIKYHRRPDNRLSADRDEALERVLRADRLQVLQLVAAIHMDASLAVADVEAVGSHIVESERAIDSLHGLRADFEANGPVPWPIDTGEPLDDAELARGQPASVDWPVVSAFVSRWYSAAIARLQQLVEVRLAPALVARGLARFPRHADLLLARGSFVETRLAFSRVDASVASVLYPADTRQRWRDELSEAEADLARAAQSAGPASEAAVRLARVRLLKGQADEARALLDRVLAGDVPIVIRYLALLFRAAAAEESGHVEDATRDYRAAVDLLPGAQTPMLALGRIADDRNQPADARAWIERALASTGTSDPWRRYIQAQGWQAAARVARLRTLESR